MLSPHPISETMPLSNHIASRAIPSQAIASKYPDDPFQYHPELVDERVARI
jgi:hypothetical protein